MGKKLKVAWVTFACCEDSSIMFVELLNDHFFEWKDKLDFRVCRILQKAHDLKDIDVAFIEGAIATKGDLHHVKEIRAASKKVVAIGSCACTGMPSAQRNVFDDATKQEIEIVINRFGHLDKVQPLKEVIKVDYEVPGCPMDEKIFLSVLETCLKEFGIQ
jgi:sulfhydrogenase subunit delta